jgi:hypothetical protein
MADLNTSDIEARRCVILEATYQAEKLLDAMQLAARAKDLDGLEFLIRGVVPRLHHLNGVVMRSLNDSETLESLQEGLDS